ncbi:MAG TPA: S1/P1 nuclease [Thermoanaerobaculia bacterium]|nr:S1/P1 nuclease [Thermoanaerobaculia bacterium]
MKFRVVVVLIAALLPCRSAMAWGTLGHRLVARIASADLPPVVDAGIRELLGKETLVTVSTLPDEWRVARPETGIWHFVDIPLTARAYDQTRDCHKGDCLVEAFERFEKILADRSKPLADRREALIFIVHLIADAHQPLHTTSNHDRGANDVKIRYKNMPMSLHKYWDADVLETGEDEARHAERLIAATRRRNASQLQKGNIESWVNETHSLATNVYRVPGSVFIDSSYESWSRVVADEQLVRAGLRLRSILIRYLS